MALLQENQEIRETYTVERFLGQGAFAEVYRVRHRFLGRQAMKVFKQADVSLEAIQASLEEALVLSRLEHPNIVRVYDANVLVTPLGNRPFFTMQHLAGGNLTDFWRSRKCSFPVSTVVDIFIQVAQALAIAHREDPPIVHRDIKPHNLLVQEESDRRLRVFVSDFGLAKQVSPLTLLASAKGTIGFKPPEALANIDSPSADVWALGTTIYVLLTRKMPYPNLGRRDVLDARQFLTPLTEPRQINPEVDNELNRIVLATLATDREQRYADCVELLSDLELLRRSSRMGRGDRRAGAKLDAGPAGAEPTGRQEPAARGQWNTEAELEAIHALSRLPGRLPEAANRLEELLAGHPELKADHEPRLLLWRKGVCM